MLNQYFLSRIKVAAKVAAQNNYSNNKYDKKELNLDADNDNLIIEYKTAIEAISLFDEILHLKKNIDQTKKISEESNDPEIKIIVEIEILEVNYQINQLESRVKKLLLPKENIDKNNAIIEVQFDANSNESKRWADKLTEMYSQYSLLKKWKTNKIGRVVQGENYMTSVILELIGNNAYGQLKYETGIHRIESIQGDFLKITVLVMPEVCNNNLTNDVLSGLKVLPHKRIDDQNQAHVKMYYNPFDILICCQEEKSQWQNKQNALKILRGKIYRLESQNINDNNKMPSVRSYFEKDEYVIDEYLNEKFDLLMTSDGSLENIVYLHMEKHEQELLNMFESISSSSQD